MLNTYYNKCSIKPLVPVDGLAADVVPLVFEVGDHLLNDGGVGLGAPVLQ